MNIPLCLGMPRSASRMTWQIIKNLVPPEPPLGWHEDLVSEWCEGDFSWPIRGHEYLPGPPAVYTFRHPVEAYLSLRSRFRGDVGKFVPGASGTKMVAGEEIPAVDPQKKVLMTEQQADYLAMVAIGKSWTTWQRLKKDAAGGRGILFLKYEDYYDNRLQRIMDIADFVDVELTPHHAAEIHEYTSIENNAARSQDQRFYENDEVTFSHGFLGESGMQKEHVNRETMGRPGVYLERHQKFVNSVKTGIVPALEALCEMTLDMGYEL